MNYEELKKYMHYFRMEWITQGEMAYVIHMWQRTLPEDKNIIRHRRYYE